MKYKAVVVLSLLNVAVAVEVNEALSFPLCQTECPYMSFLVAFIFYVLIGYGQSMAAMFFWYLATTSAFVSFIES